VSSRSSPSTWSASKRNVAIPSGGASRSICATVSWNEAGPLSPIQRLGDDDGGDDVPVGGADGLPVPSRLDRAREAWAAVRAHLDLRAQLPAVWTTYGLAAYALYRLFAHFDFGVFDWHGGGRYLAGGAIAAAGLYELTPLKSVCLKHCRGPMQFLLHGWRHGVRGALRMGAEHGSYCVGCCWGLIVVLFALGVMSLTWMAAVAGLIFAQKVFPRGEHLTRVFAVAFIATGIWVPSAPGSVPGLTQPGEARMRMMDNDASTGMNEMKPATPMDHDSE
jgi:Predicted metal-binding integral membrane protein (DUF2182)